LRRSSAWRPYVIDRLRESFQLHITIEHTHTASIHFLALRYDAFLDMAPSGLAILIGAGPATGAGIARILAHPSHGNLAVALLARRQEALDSLAKDLKAQTPGAVFETFATDTSPDKLRKTFADIKAHQSFKGLKLQLSIYSIKNSSKKPFMSETFEDFMDPLETYVGGAMVFAQESLKRLFEDHGEKTLAEGAPK
jgi:NAD(P)-dependent dehydrogenase (short-subunit alcohol dehydrogenase family)